MIQWLFLGVISACRNFLQRFYAYGEGFKIFSIKSRHNKIRQKKYANKS